MQIAASVFAIAFGLLLLLILRQRKVLNYLVRQEQLSNKFFRVSQSDAAITRQLCRGLLIAGLLFTVAGFAGIIATVT